MARKAGPSPIDGLIIVDKPQEWTSHDVVGKLRRIVGTRRVGHGGTLDPMATGVLVCGVGKATKLLGLIGATDKSYDATISLGIATTTDDAEGELTSAVDAGYLLESGQQQIHEQVARLTGEIMQRPSSVSAIKVNGERAYKRVRAGEDVVLAERPVTITQFEILATRIASVDGPGGPTSAIDLDVAVTCSTGTYVRALARDLGERLGVGGHLTMLRRTRVGVFDLSSARTLEHLELELDYLPLADVCRRLFATHVVSDPEAVVFRHGGSTDLLPELPVGETIAVFATDDSVLGLAEARDGRLAPTVVWQPA